MPIKEITGFTQRQFQEFVPTLKKKYVLVNAGRGEGKVVSRSIWLWRSLSVSLIVPCQTRAWLCKDSLQQHQQGDENTVDQSLDRRETSVRRGKRIKRDRPRITY
jgi:hypothetical protein